MSDLTPNLLALSTCAMPMSRGGYCKNGATKHCGMGTILSAVLGSEVSHQGRLVTTTQSASMQVKERVTLLCKDSFDSLQTQRRMLSTLASS